MANYLTHGVNFLAFVWKCLRIERFIKINPLSALYMGSFLAVLSA